MFDRRRSGETLKSSAKSVMVQVPGLVNVAYFVLLPLLLLACEGS
jgi:hypothetical protein